MLLYFLFLYVLSATGLSQGSDSMLNGGTQHPVSSIQHPVPPVKPGGLSLFEKSEIIEGKDFRDPHQLAYWPIIPGTDRVWVDGVLKSRDVDYTIDYRLGLISIKEEVSRESVIRIDYRIIPISVQKSYQRQLFAPQVLKSPRTRGSEEPPPGEVPEVQAVTPEEPPAALSFSGTKTLSLSMESVRGLTINQPTRLNVSGKVSEDVSVMAMLSDQDLPLQPEGTTEELEDLDKILIKIQGKHLSATLGDYEAGFGETEFVLSPKMLEGAQAQGEFDAGGFTLLGAVSKGQTSSVTFPGVEGQNEYRIDVDSRYIVMIAGSETVWLNGEKMRRGEENDYVIRDYGDPIVEFTNKHLITSSDVIVVDFEYIEEDRSYRQDLYGARGKVNLMDMGEGLTLGVSYATESDDKDNPLILLSSEDIVSLRRNDLDPDGDGVLLPAPVKRSVMGFDGRLSLTENTDFKGEVALSRRDMNTFSTFDEPEEGKAWKLNGSSSAGKLHVNFDLRELDPNFVPIGATFSSRTRSTYQEEYDDVAFGEVPPGIQATPPGEASYDLDLWYEPIRYVELRGDLGRITREYPAGADLVSAPSRTNHWSRSLKIALPNLPQLNTKYQEAVTQVGGEDELRKTRDLWELNHRLWEKLNIGVRSEEMESVICSSDPSGRYYVDTGPYVPASSSDRRREERRLTFEVPALKKVSLSGAYSFEMEYTKPTSSIQAFEKASDSYNLGEIFAQTFFQKACQRPVSSIQYQASSSARTVSANLSAKPESWLDFSGYFARRKFSRLSEESDSTIPADSTTNLADLNLNLSPLRINYQIDRKLSTEREEQYVDYILTKVDGREEKRFLRPGEGSYVKIDEYTYREDMEKGDYIRLVRTVSDRPVTSLALQSVFSLRPRSSFRTKPVVTGPSARPSIVDRLTRPLSMLEIGFRLNEEQENASRGFYLLQDLQTDKTIYGLRRYWYRAQISPVRRFELIADWETGRTLNKRINSRARELISDRWDIKLESPLMTKFSLGGEWEQSNSSETVSSLLEANANDVISDISERQRSQSVFLRYHPARALSRVKLEGTYETERDEDALSSEPPVFTKTIALGSEATWSFRGRGTTTMQYEIARGTSSGRLPFARYDFHEGISHHVRLETNYRLEWFTDLTARLIYRVEIAQREKPDHRLEMEMTASF